MDRIPSSVIGILSKIIPEHYTRSEIESPFLYCGVPDGIDGTSKEKLVIEALRSTNMNSEKPLKVLGLILEDFMNKELRREGRIWGQQTPSDYEVNLESSKQQVRDTLSREGLAYAQGGSIVSGSATPTLSLEESVRKHGLPTVDIEIKRALAQLEADPHAAAQYAANVLEATIKAYLDKKSVPYGGGDTLSELWKLAAAHMGLRPQDWDDRDLKKIASGLNGIVDGITHLRNNKSGAHGKSADQARQYIILPRHARLAIHSAHTIAAYVLELID